jgi:hypothetical protein
MSVRRRFVEVREATRRSTKMSVKKPRAASFGGFRQQARTKKVSRRV